MEEAEKLVLTLIIRKVIMVPDPRLDSSHHGNANQVLSSLLDFNPKEWGLPPFEDSES